MENNIQNNALYIPAKWFPTQGQWQSQLTVLSDEDVGKLFKAALNYLNSGICPEFENTLLDFAFIPIKAEIEASQKAFTAKREGGKKGGQKRGGSKKTKE
ncbi:hypothetical protein SAMN04487770_102171 [Butyrivibrio sp. ob235]|uniref:DUF6291 domain-containing protein n=1 Tax=Butyrivibrio sp. ob235 TaxID=1761780 RepID=UPI0008D0FD5C|nr:DUF6291 domain-containing protein [Butyrivibrio sp. ob235]SEK64911.1 hypothetical protein SAMN04487770_102171 [Butyrivibrio sp. ob235]